jgi:hypothetical protein
MVIDNNNLSFCRHQRAGAGYNYLFCFSGAAITVAAVSLRLNRHEGVKKPPAVI